jgi:toxin ParE1/3/4
MKIVFAREAIEDLVAIGEYIAESNPARSDTFVDELEDRCIKLAETPFAYARIVHGSNRKIRRRPYCQYLIIDEIGVQRIDILRIVHGAQDYEKILFPDD